jgi:hypothetical protein
MAKTTTGSPFLLSLPEPAYAFLDTISKTATKRANGKVSKLGQHFFSLRSRLETELNCFFRPDKADKPKRAPTAYNQFVKAHMTTWLADNKDKNVKDAMVAVCPHISSFTHPYL